jgi:hypothetical protein
LLGEWRGGGRIFKGKERGGGEKGRRNLGTKQCGTSSLEEEEEGGWK